MKQYFNFPMRLVFNNWGSHLKSQNMTRFKTPYNANEFPQKPKKFRGVSLTRPDESMTMKEILLRHSRGLPIKGAKVPLYEADENGEGMPDMRNLDLAEKQELMDSAREEMERIREEHRKKVYRNKLIKDKELKEKAQKETDSTNPEKSGEGKAE